MQTKAATEHKTKTQTQRKEVTMMAKSVNAKSNNVPAEAPKKAPTPIAKTEYKYVANVYKLDSKVLDLTFRVDSIRYKIRCATATEIVDSNYPDVVVLKQLEDSTWEKDSAAHISNNHKSIVFKLKGHENKFMIRTTTMQEQLDNDYSKYVVFKMIETTVVPSAL